MKRACGMLLPVASLPSEYGIGAFSKEAYAFVDQLAEAGQRYWQILPLGPTGYGDSPYQSFSAFAGNPYFIDLEELIARGLLTKAECDAADLGTDPQDIDYEKQYFHRFPLLKRAFGRWREQQKKKGRIRHLGFSTHGGLELMERFLSQYGKDMEFCQIQLNYLDWTMQDAKAKCELLRRYSIPIWVMEPVRGGRLASLTPEAESELHALRPEESTAAWAFRFLQGVEGVQMILSGMTTPEQMQDNVRTFAERRPLTEQEEKVLLDIAKGMYGAVPCTGCRYCCDGCPMGLNIPMLLQIYNEMKFSPCTNVGMRVDALPEDKRPAACVGCGQCTRACPQNIDIPTVLRDLDEELKKIPSWAEICRQREEAARRAREAR